MNSFFVYIDNTLFDRYYFSINISMQWTSHNLDDTFHIASTMLERVSEPYWFLLGGGLGAGKTHLAKGFGMALGISPEEVQSPTFVYLSVLQGKEVQYFHFDLYRLEEPKEADGMILQYREHFPHNFVVVEWSEKLSSDFRNLLIREGFKVIQCSEVDENTRTFTLT